MNRSISLLVLPLLFLLPARDVGIAQSAMRNLSGGADLGSNAIYETNYRSNTIQVFSLTGSDLGVFAMPTYPTGLAFDETGNLYVSSDDPAGYSIMKFSPDGSTSVFANSGLNGPHALAIDRAGNLYVANARDDTIKKVNPDGTSAVFADKDDGLKMPLDLIFDALGNLFVSNAYGGPTNTGSVEKFTPVGVGSVFADTGFHTAYGLAFDSAGNLYVSNYRSSTIEKFSSTGTDLGVFASAGVNHPRGMVFDSLGNLYVANNGNSTIEKFSPTGIDLGIFAHTGGGPHFLALGSFSAGHLHFESEALRKQASSAGYRILHDENASGGAYALLKANMTGDFLTYTVPIVTGGTYEVKVGIQTRKDKGIFQLAIAGINLGAPQDEYSSTTGYEVRDLGTVTFTGAGDTEFQFAVVGRNPTSHGYTLAFDYIDLDLVP